MSPDRKISMYIMDQHCNYTVYPSSSAVSIKHSPFGSLVESNSTSAATNCPSSIKIISPTCTSFHFTSTTLPFLTVFEIRLFTWSSFTCLCWNTRHDGNYDKYCNVIYHAQKMRNKLMYPSCSPILRCFIIYVRNRRRHLWWQWSLARRPTVSKSWLVLTTRLSISFAASWGTGSRNWLAVEIVRINSTARTSTGYTLMFLCNSSEKKNYFNMQIYYLAHWATEYTPRGHALILSLTA